MSAGDCPVLKTDRDAKISDLARKWYAAMVAARDMQNPTLPKLQVANIDVAFAKAELFKALAKEADHD